MRSSPINSVAAWLDGNGAVPAGIAAVNGLAENLRLQDRIAQSLKESAARPRRAELWKPSKRRPVFDGDQIRDLEVEQKNRAKEIIEDFMIAANGVTARYLAGEEIPFHPPRGAHAQTLGPDCRACPGTRSPGCRISPDSAALDAFLVKEKAADPLRFPDLSLAVIKLLGAGEYVAEQPGDTAPGHFGLAVKDYAHSTAPNRRYADLITQRLLKAAIAGRACAV